MDRLRCLFVAGMLAVTVCVVAAGPAGAAKGGNNDTAKACQHGGWKTLGLATGGTFASQGDCVNDGAQGSAPFGTYGLAACNKIGGIFMLNQRINAWSCAYTDPANTPALQTACTQDGAGFMTETSPPEIVALCG